MSKKIAQLTKVIFHLHSKNEENNQMQQAVSNAYEKEIETLLSQANTTLQKQKDALIKANEGAQLKEKIKELEVMHKSEREDSQKAFKDYQDAIKSKESRIESDHLTKCQDMKTEVQEIRKAFEAKMIEFKRQVDEFKKNNEALEALKKAH